ncbi:MAG: M48 family metalloprotease [Bacteroidota bacterium]
MGGNFKFRILVMLLMGGIALFSYYSRMEVNPITGKKQAVSLTPEQEIAMGLQSAPQMAAEFGGIYSDPKAQGIVKAIGNKLVNGTQAKESPYQFDFHLLADPETINAFALPGGQIFITVGLLKRLNTEDQIAGVLAHEIGHVIGRHSAQQMAKSDLTNGLLGAVVSATADPYGNNSAGAIASYVGNMVNMKYGREDELESDKYGVRYMQETGYNPAAMIDVMEILKQAAGGAERPSEFQSTHPDPDHRIGEIKKMIENFKNTGSWDY